MERKNKSTDDLMDSLTQSQDLQSFMNENDSDFRQDDIATYLQTLLKEKTSKKKSGDSGCYAERSVWLPDFQRIKNTSPG